MSDAGTGEVSRQTFAIAYSGKERPDDHSINVDALAPALLAFGRLIREANAEFNGNRTTSKVLVCSDFENKCFHIDFNVAISYYEHLKTLLGAEPVRTAKEILEWIGLLKDHNLAKVGVLSFFQFLRAKGPREIETTRELTDKDGNGLVQVTIKGDHPTVTVNQNVYNLSQNPKALRAARDAFTPIGQDGFDTFEIREGDRAIEEFTPPDTQAIIAACNVGIDSNEDNEPDIEVTTAWLSVYSPVFDTNARMWRFKLGRRHEYVDISETRIAEDALKRGGSFAEDAYQVRLEIRTPKDKNGRARPSSFKIIEVIKFVSGNPAVQGSLFDGRS